MKNMYINGKQLKKALFYLLLILTSVIMIGPFFWQIMTSIKPQSLMFSTQLSLFARSPETGRITMTLENYLDVFHELNFLRYFSNTFFVAAVNILLNLILNSMAAYSFARIPFKGREVIFKGLLTTLMVPGTVLLIPSVYIVKTLGLYNHLGALIFPYMMSVYNVFMMRQFFYSIPVSVEESARIDGANRLQVFFRIALPLVKPALVTLGIMTFIWNYNNYLWPMVVLNDPKKYTISLGLGQLVTVGKTKEHLMISGSVVASLPSIIIYLIFQRQIVEGIMAGSVKE